jgi:hypothetical protein
MVDDSSQNMSQIDVCIFAVICKNLENKYAILSQERLAAAKEIVHEFMTNPFDHLTA